MSNSTINVINPANEEVLATVDCFDPEQVNETVLKSEKAFLSWSSFSPRTKVKKLHEIADLIDRNLEVLARIESSNTGKPIGDARWEIAEAAYVFHYFAGIIENHRGSTIPVEGGIDLTIPEPLGVVAGIVPWNFPFLISSWKIAPAIACGNSVILKPAELTPLSALKFKELLKEVDLPQDLILIAPGYGHITGVALVENPKVAKISFTGSTEVGKEILVRSSHNLKRVTLELGGKSAMIIFQDADIQKAADLGPYAIYQNAGQDCCARSRVLVQESIFDNFLDLFLQKTKALKVGDPLQSDCEMGPLISKEHLEKVRGFLEDGDERVSLIYKRRHDSSKGYFFGPVILESSDLNPRVATQEIFGPVSVFIKFKDEEEAIKMANDTIYGLSGSIWTRDIGKALRVASGVKSGTLSVNSNTSVRTNTPFGGFKQSGYGKELGLEAMNYYSELKNIYISTS